MLPPGQALLDVHSHRVHPVRELMVFLRKTDWIEMRTGTT